MYLTFTTSNFLSIIACLTYLTCGSQHRHWPAIEQNDLAVAAQLHEEASYYLSPAKDPSTVSAECVITLVPS